jgi:hypothetical protein
VPAATSSTILSRPIDLPRGAVAEWDLSSNLVIGIQQNSPALQVEP